MKRWLASAVLGVVLSVVGKGAGAQTPRRSGGTVELVNDAECNAKGRVPSTGLAAIMRTSLARETQLEPGTDRAEFFRISNIQLGQGRRSFRLVCGLGPMAGADNGWYWILTTSAQHPRVLLEVGTDALWLLPVSHDGYPDLKSWWGVAAQSRERIFRFDGKRYVMASRRCYEPLPGNMKSKRTKCY